MESFGLFIEPAHPGQACTKLAKRTKNKRNKFFISFLTLKISKKKAPEGAYF